MYYSVTGKLLHTEPFLAVISCAGVGYKCVTTMTTLSCLPPIGDEATLYTHLNVREDALDLYGFYSREECTSFRQLTSVSGVGPKSALAILSDLTSDQLALCIAGGDVKALTRAPGIGPKVAQRLILELKDKMFLTGDDGSRTAASGHPAQDLSSVGEAVAALCVLGYSQAEASRALTGADTALPVDELVKYGLRALSKRK